MSHRGRKHALKVCRPSEDKGDVGEVSGLCPKHGRGFWRRYPWLIWVFPIAGLASLIWFLIRVVPKPSRATYPCQRIAAPLASGFIVWAMGLVGSALAYRKARRLMGRSRYVVAGIFAAAAIMAVWWSVSMTQGSGAKAAPFVPTDPPNSPMGVAKGIYPGRVMWIRDANATSWNGSTGSWWDDTNTNQALVDNMISSAIQGLTGESSDADAWDALFRHFNQTHGFGDVGYQAGEKIAIKINMNQENSTAGSWSSSKGTPSPHVVYSFVKQLMDVVGVPGSSITIYDAARYIGNPIYNKVRSDPNPDYRNIKFVVKSTLAANGRIGATYSSGRPIRTRASQGNAYPPTCVTEAKYLINTALLRAHSLYGVTLCAKNHFGSVRFPSWSGDGGWTPEPLHSYGQRSNAMGTYNCLVDLNGHADLGGKTLLYFIDALYPARNQSDAVTRFRSFGNDWFSSILASQDPVAIDSVGLDFLRAEQETPGTTVTDVIDRPDNYLHEMAMANNPPSGTFYDPEQDGTRLESLGVHEHWNNPASRQYSRNLGTGDGIELVTQHELWTSADGPIRNLTRERRYDYIQYAINDARDGDEIVVPQSVYPENINLKGKNLTIRSAEPDNPATVAATIISGAGGGPVVTLQGGEDANCVLSGLTIAGGDVGIYCSGASPTISNCVVKGNTGMGVRLWNVSRPAITDSLIVANGGGGIELSQGRGITSSVTITNCTIAGNSGTGVYSGVQTITNSIIYYNDPAQIFGTLPTVTFSDVQGGWPGEGNIDADPCFADPCNGDYHLKSEAGRWDPGSGSWVLDGVTSLCIDGGNPTSDWTAELWPHGKRINMGKHGGTPEASMSLSDAGSAADLNIDEVVDFRDFDGFSGSWRKEELFLREDIDRNGRVDAFDLAAFAEEWLWRE